jgi:hypothetical protein
VCHVTDDARLGFGIWIEKQSDQQGRCKKSGQGSYQTAMRRTLGKLPCEARSNTRLNFIYLKFTDLPIPAEIRSADEGPLSGNGILWQCGVVGMEEYVLSKSVLRVLEGSEAGSLSCV